MTWDEKKFPTGDKKKLPTFENNICVKFDSRQRKKFPTFFLSSHVKFYANVNLKCRHFLSWVKHKKLISRVGNFLFVLSQILRKKLISISPFMPICSSLGSNFHWQVFLCSPLMKNLLYVCWQSCSAAWSTQQLDSAAQ